MSEVKTNSSRKNYKHNKKSVYTLFVGLCRIRPNLSTRALQHELTDEFLSYVYTISREFLESQKDLIRKKQIIFVCEKERERHTQRPTPSLFISKRKRYTNEIWRKKVCEKISYLR